MEKNNIENIKIKIEKGFLIVIRNGKSFRFELSKISERLAKASDEELKDFTISPSGYGIHWSLIDEDISIPALLNEPRSNYGQIE